MAGDSAEVPGREEPLAVRVGARALVIVEDVVYAAAAVLLAIGAALALLLAGQSVLHVLRDQDETPLIELLNSLFLVFIFVELLYAVRITVSRRRVVAEPFLVVGILGAIKELLVLSVRAGTDYIDKGPEFARAIVEVGVLGALVLVLSPRRWCCGGGSASRSRRVARGRGRSTPATGNDRPRRRWPARGA